MEKLTEEDKGNIMSESRLQKLEGRTYHIDGKVAAIETQLGTQGAQLTRIEQHMLTPKPPVNYGVWVGIGLTILFGFGSALMAVSSYMDMQLDGVRQAIVAVDDDMALHRSHAVRDQENEMTRMFTSGKRAGKLEDLSERLAHVDELFHEMDKRVRVNSAKGQEAEVSRKAIGDYVKELHAEHQADHRDGTL